MKNPGIIDGIVVTIGISLAAAAASLLLGGLLTKAALLGLILYGATLAYLLFLLRRSSARVGRVVVISGWGLATLACWLLQLPLLEQVLVQAGVIWMVRSAYFHASLLSATLDLGLILIGLAASAWAMLNTGSFIAALWSFFLLQSLFCLLPQFARTQAKGAAAVAAGDRGFESAHRVAVDAVRKLTQP